MYDEKYIKRGCYLQDLIKIFWQIFYVKRHVSQPLNKSKRISEATNFSATWMRNDRPPLLALAAIHRPCIWSPGPHTLIIITMYDNTTHYIIIITSNTFLRFSSLFTGIWWSANNLYILAFSLVHQFLHWHTVKINHFTDNSCDNDFTF